MSCLPAVAALAAALGLPGCSPTAPSRPTFYASLASPGANVDAETARAMISAYRRNNGLAPLASDSGLAARAREEARAMAQADKPASADAAVRRLAGEGLSRDAVGVNFSAGYHTLAEAFSGWRDSPQHNAVMLKPGAKRMGIATAYAPGSKYKVYWALVVAGD